MGLLQDSLDLGMHWAARHQALAEVAVRVRTVAAAVHRLLLRTVAAAHLVLLRTVVAHPVLLRTVVVVHPVLLSTLAAAHWVLLSTVAAAVVRVHTEAVTHSSQVVVVAADHYQDTAVLEEPEVAVERSRELQEAAETPAG